MAESKVTLKLLIDTKGKRVLFAEASKDFVDFIFHIVSLPVATVIRLLGRQGMVGSLGNLYDSIENLNDEYIRQDQNFKDILLKPTAPNPITPVPLLLLNDHISTDKTFYACSSCKEFRITDDPRSICPRCSRKMTMTVTYVAPPSFAEGSNNSGGFVKGVVTYMVMDNMEVKPVSTISSIALLNKFNVKEVDVLQEKVVNFGMDEVINMVLVLVWCTLIDNTIRNNSIRL
ncbi:Protein of unknown function (DUF674) [Abeliophyllum distichum]|uniref:DUF674 domain-containing protein n=1 Tax=Abeliophyllum distichum TaxID=126358 RepID=A0ABD1RB56_9LAMI